MTTDLRQGRSLEESFTAEHIPTALAQILSDLQRRLGRDDPTTIVQAIASASLTKGDIAPFRKFSDKSYERNLVFRSEQFELLILCWHSGQLSPLHNHKGSSCYMRILEGTATELRFERAQCGVLAPSGVKNFECGSVAASFDEDIHTIANFQSSDLITMHCYSPPLLKPEIFPIADSFIPQLQGCYSNPIQAGTYVEHAVSK